MVRAYKYKKSRLSEDKRDFHGAGDEARTRYLHLGKVALYRMSYTRGTRLIIADSYKMSTPFCKISPPLFRRRRLAYIVGSVMGSMGSVVGGTSSGSVGAVGAGSGVAG